MKSRPSRHGRSDASTIIGKRISGPFGAIEKTIDPEDGK